MNKKELAFAQPEGLVMKKKLLYLEDSNIMCSFAKNKK